jgi:bZIP transcription factor
MMTSLSNADSAADAAAGVLCTLPFIRGSDSKWHEDEPALKKTKLFHVEKKEFLTTALPLPPKKKMATSTKSDTQATTTGKTKANKPLPRAGKVIASTLPAATTDPNDTTKPSSNGPVSSMKRMQDPVKKKETRLEQNRRAAKESRQRKNIMVEELQRSVVFFTRANSTSKDRNNELVRLVKEAMSCNDIQQSDRDVLDKALDDNNNYVESKYTSSRQSRRKTETESKETETAQLLTRLNQSPVYEENAKVNVSEPIIKKDDNETPVFVDGLSTNVDVAIAATSESAPNETMISSVPSMMQPGSTMQAMATFQQAATAAMEEAMKGLQNTNGFPTLRQLEATGAVSIATHATTAPMLTPPSSAVSPSVVEAAMSSAVSNAQQAYNDTLQAFAMQQATRAFAASGGTPNPWMFPGLPYMMGPAAMLAWQFQQQPYLQQPPQVIPDVAAIAAWADLYNLKKHNA